MKLCVSVQSEEVGRGYCSLDFIVNHWPQREVAKEEAEINIQCAKNIFVVF